MIDAFFQWYESNPHHNKEDYYQNTITRDYLSRLSKSDFIEFFYKFAHEGGQVQSGGYRTSGRFRKMLESKYDQFKKFLLNPFEENFDEAAWLVEIKGYNSFGIGLATIYLNRVNKGHFPILNNKAIDALNLFDIQFPTNNVQRYQTLRNAQKQLITWFPKFDNFFKTDSLAEFLIGDKAGRPWKELLEKTSSNLLKEKDGTLPRPIWKISHGKVDFNAEQRKIYLEQRTVHVHKDTKKGQGVLFANEINEGDFFYLCHGNDDGVRIFGRITNPALPSPHLEGFLQRSYDILFESIKPSVKYAGIKKGWAPNYNSTCMKVPNEELNLFESEILKPFFGKRLSDISGFSELSASNVSLSSRNNILYGPPGTGKTYYTVNHALSIIEGRNLIEYENIERDELHRKFEEYKNNGQIGFVTFHQSFSYEDFIEGIKPVSTEDSEDKPGELGYEIQDGVFKYMCQKAQAEYHRENGAVYNFDSKKIDFYKMSLGGIYRPDIHEWCIDNNCLAIGWGEDNDFSSLNKYPNWKEFRDHFKKEFPELVKDNKYVIQAIFIFMKMKEGDMILVSKGNSKIDAIGKVTGSYEYNNETPIDFYQFRKVEWLITNLDSPADLFVRKKLSQQTIYEFYKEAVKTDYLKQLLGSKKTDNHNYVLIIDEINRGNVANIFGELITLIEDDKRRGMTEELSTTLPYSKKEFSVPSNLFIVGTMNTADRSVEALDTALRRRFSFLEMRPDVNKVKNPEGLDVDLKKMMDKINTRIEALLDKDHCIGHSYFMGLEQSKNPEKDLKMIFKDKIIPLLEEYFYCDPVKIGMVLGQSFVENKNGGGNRVVFAPGFENELDDFEEKHVYKINNPLDFETLAPFKKIYE